MEAKKSKRANLENKKWFFFQTGLIISLSIVILALNWKSEVSEKIDFSKALRLDDGFDNTIITRREEPIKVIPPKLPDLSSLIIIKNTGFETPIVIFDPEDIPLFPPDYGYGEKEEVDSIFWIVEKNPTYKGGNKERFWSDMKSKLRYPPLAAENSIEGTVYTQFVIDKKGNITNIEIIRSDDPILSEEVKKVLASSDKWEPGEQRGKPVRVAFTMPFKFALQK